MQIDEPVDVSVDGALLRITLNRPDKYNAVSESMLAGLDAALDRAEATPGIRVVLLEGAGRHFCAGADISAYHEARADDLAAFTAHANAVCDRLAGLALPVIAAVHGLALGGGFELALSCDLVVAADTASFGLPELALGLIPGWGGTQRLTAVVGAARARQVILTGARIDAATLQQWGLVGQLSTAESLTSDALALAAQLAERAPLAMAAAKQAVAAARPADGFAIERSALLSLFASADGKEGVAAFVAKRPPEFHGK